MLPHLESANAPNLATPEQATHHPIALAPKASAIAGAGGTPQAYWGRNNIAPRPKVLPPSSSADGQVQVIRVTCWTIGGTKVGPVCPVEFANETPTLRSGAGPLILATQSLRRAMDDLVEAAFTLRRVTP